MLIDYIYGVRTKRRIHANPLNIYANPVKFVFVWVHVTGLSKATYPPSGLGIHQSLQG